MRLDSSEFGLGSLLSSEGPGGTGMGGIMGG